MFGVSYMVNALNPQKTNLMQKMHIFILNMNLSQHKLYVNISKIKTIYSFSLKKPKCNKNHRQCYVIFIIQRTEFLPEQIAKSKSKRFFPITVGLKETRVVTHKPMISQISNIYMVSTFSYII